MQTYYHFGKPIQAFRFDGTMRQLYQELPTEIFDSIQERLMWHMNYEQDHHHNIIAYWPTSFCGIQPHIQYPHQRIKRPHRRTNSWRIWYTQRTFRDKYYHYQTGNYDANHYRPYYYAADARYGMLYKYLQSAIGIHVGDYVSVKYQVKSNKGISLSGPFKHKRWTMMPSVRIYQNLNQTGRRKRCKHTTKNIAKSKPSNLMAPGDKS